MFFNSGMNSAKVIAMFAATTVVDAVRVSEEDNDDMKAWQAAIGVHLAKLHNDTIAKLGQPSNYSIMNYLIVYIKIWCAR